MQLYGGRNSTLSEVSNHSYVSRGKRSSRYHRILVLRPLKKRERRQAKKDIIEWIAAWGY